MWKVGDRVVITQGRKTNRQFKTGIQGTIRELDNGRFLSIGVIFDSGIFVWLHDKDVFLNYEEIVCTRVRKRKNNYY